MNEQNDRIYLNLIECLLTCPRGQEEQILEANAELVSLELVSLMQKQAERLSNEGRTIESAWLSSLSKQLLYRKIWEPLEINLVSKSDLALSSIPAPDYLYLRDRDFLLEALNIIEDKRYPEALYPFLEQNIDKLNHRSLSPLIEKNASLEFAGSSPEKAYCIARDYEAFGWAVLNFPEGNYLSKQEIAIISYNAALKGFKLAHSPLDCARVQYRLGHSYLQRNQGDRADNLEQAIESYNNVLQVLTDENSSADRAETHLNLGTAYAQRIQSDRAENLEQSIYHYQQALRVLNKQDNAYAWALAKNSLAATYTNRIKGQPSKNLEFAIAAHQEALTVFTAADFPYEWAETQYNLANLVRGRDELYLSQNIETAIALFKEALNIFTRESYPYQWAKVNTELARTYSQRGEGEITRNLEQALAYCQQALRVYTPKYHPYEWADVQQTLANIYASTTEDRENYLAKAIIAYERSLSIFTPQDFPLECCETARNFGHIAYRHQRWDIAVKGYSQSIEAAEQLRIWSISDTHKENVLSQAIDAYFGIVKAYLNLGRESDALEYVERSKARNLVELLSSRELHPTGDISETTLNKLDGLRRKIISEQKRLEVSERNGTFGETKPQAILTNSSQLRQLQKQLDELIRNEIAPKDSKFSLTQKVEPISFKYIQSLIDERTTILEWYLTKDEIFTFLITKNSSQPQVFSSSQEVLNDLVDFGNEYLSLYYNNRKQWKVELETRLQRLSEILGLARILEYVSPECERLILIPHRFLHIFPLHALPVSTTEERGTRHEAQVLAEAFLKGVQYIPSCQLLQLIKSYKRPHFKTFFAVQNPTEDIIYTDLEVEAIRSFFQKSEVLQRQAATEEALKNYPNFSSIHCAHFSCHGEFNLTIPLESALILANKEPWTLGEIFEISLPQCRLVTLSACETGLIDLQSISDEYVGLPSGFLFAGSSIVLSSLWSVSALSTAFLMIKLYEILFDEDSEISVSVALKQAQHWLKNLTTKKLLERLEEPGFQQVCESLKRRILDTEFLELKYAIFDTKAKYQNQAPQSKPFENPFYWAAFIISGYDC